MCGRFALDLDLDQLIDSYLVTHNRYPDWAPRWNIAPTQQIPILVDRLSDSGSIERVLGPARWSLTPSWSKTLELPYPTFNARSESAGTKPSFRGALSTSRALIPASAYYEWHTEGRTKTPYAIMGNTGQPLAFAGLYSTWSDGASSIVTATILTTDALPEMAWLHPRSPVLTPPPLWQDWLDPKRRFNQDDLDSFVDQARETLPALRYYEVAPLRGDGPELLREVPDVRLEG